MQNKVEYFDILWNEMFQPHNMSFFYHYKDENVWYIYAKS